jgi:hypothetical protein
MMHLNQLLEKERGLLCAFQDPEKYQQDRGPPTGITLSVVRTHYVLVLPYS